MTSRSWGVRWASRGVLAALFGWSIGGLIAGCGRSGVEDACERIEDLSCRKWSGKAECIDDGRAIERRVGEAGGCDGAFDDYLQCVSQAGTCEWEISCSAERADLQACIGPL